MMIKKFHIYLANLEPSFGTEPGKTRPVVVVQTDLLNEFHPSAIICHITTNVQRKAEILRVHIPKKESGLKTDSDILVDQIRAIDVRRLIKEIGKVPLGSQKKLLDNLQILLIE